MPISYVQLDPWAWKGYVASAETKLPGGHVFWRGAGELISWTAEPSFFPTDGFVGLSNAGAVATPDKQPMPLLLYSLWWEENKTAAFYKAKYNEDYKFVTGGWRRASGERVIAQPSPDSSRAFYNRVIGDHKEVIGALQNSHQICCESIFAGSSKRTWTYVCRRVRDRFSLVHCAYF